MKNFQANDFSYRLKEAMTSQGMKAIELSRATGIEKSAISEYLSGKYKAKQQNVHKLARALGVTEAWLMGFDFDNADEDSFPLPSDLRPIGTKRYPYLGAVACGDPIYAEEDRESYIDLGVDIRCDFVLTAKGDSMINARIYDGDLVFVRKQDYVDDGEIAVVILDDEVTLKRVRRKGGIILLLPENPAYEPIIVGGDNETRTVRVLGKAVAFQSDIR